MDTCQPEGAGCQDEQAEQAGATPRAAGEAGADADAEQRDKRGELGKVRAGEVLRQRTDAGDGQAEHDDGDRDACEGEAEDAGDQDDAEQRRQQCARVERGDLERAGRVVRWTTWTIWQAELRGAGRRCRWYAVWPEGRMELNELPDRAVPPHLLQELRRWLFDEYVPGFTAQDPSWVPALQLKADHTRRVCEEILQLGDEVGLQGDALRLAELAALLHDIARFEQYAQYQTYADSRSFDHAQAGVEIIGELGLLQPLQPRVRELVLAAVRNHNRAAVPENGSPAELFFSRLLRDADKLDIWRVVIAEYRDPQGHAFARLELPDTSGHSAAALQALRGGRMVRLADLRNLNDFKLLQLGWVHDLNFRPTFARVRERGYVEALLELLPDDPEVEQVGEVLLSLVQRRAES